MPSEVRFVEVRKKLEQAGFELARINGSHHIFSKSGVLPISIPVHRGKVKPTFSLMEPIRTNALRTHVKPWSVR